MSSFAPRNNAILRSKIMCANGEAVILLAVLALATVALALTGANAQTANTKLALGNLGTASE